MKLIFFTEWRTLLQPILVDSEEVLEAGAAAETEGVAVTVAVEAGAVDAEVAGAGVARRKRNGSR